MKCRHCKNVLNHKLIDLGSQPPSNSYLTYKNLNCAEIYLPLKVYVCDQCYLVQTADFTQRETFFNSDYAYFSSTSKTWLAHAKSYVESIIKELDLNKDSFVIEVASNDGCLLKNFVEKKIPCIGVEPTKSTASQSKSLGISTIIDFYSVDLAKSLKTNYGGADLIVCNNVYAHVPDINNFTEALEVSLNDNGVVTIEFPHLLNLIELCQFDTIYHEHYSYLSVDTVSKIFATKGLRIFKVEEIPTHGGSVRLYACKINANYKMHKSVIEIVNREKAFGLFDLHTFHNFQSRADKIKLDLLSFLINLKLDKKVVCGYGAAAKGNTLLNYAGIKSDLLPFVADAAVAKIGKFMPGSRIPIKPPEEVIKLCPDYVIIFPWNIADEVKSQFSGLLDKGCKFVTFVPYLKEI